MEKRLCFVLALLPIILFAQERALDHAIAARKFFEDGDQKNALMAYSKAIELDQIKPEYYYERGRVKRHIGKPGAAATDFEIAVIFDRRYKDAWFQLGLASFEAARFERALSALNMTLFLDLKYAEAEHWRGCTLMAMGKEESAIRSLAKATLINPKAADSFLQLGRANARIGKLQDAFAAYSKAISLEARNPELHCARALTQLQQAVKAPEPKEFLAAAAVDMKAARAVTPGLPELLALDALYRWLADGSGEALKSIGGSLKNAPKPHRSELQLKAWSIAVICGDRVAAAEYLKPLQQGATPAGVRNLVEMLAEKQVPSRMPGVRLSVDAQQAFSYYAGVKALSAGNPHLATKWLKAAATRQHNFEGLAAALALKKLKDRAH